MFEECLKECSQNISLNIIQLCCLLITIEFSKYKSRLFTKHFISLSFLEILDFCVWTLMLNEHFFSHLSSTLFPFYLEQSKAKCMFLVELFTIETWCEFSDGTFNLRHPSIKLYLICFMCAVWRLCHSFCMPYFTIKHRFLLSLLEIFIQLIYPVRGSEIQSGYSCKVYCSGLWLDFHPWWTGFDPNWFGCGGTTQ